MSRCEHRGREPGAGRGQGPSTWRNRHGRGAVKGARKPPGTVETIPTPGGAHRYSGPESSRARCEDSHPRATNSGSPVVASHVLSGGLVETAGGRRPQRSVVTPTPRVLDADHRSCRRHDGKADPVERGILELMLHRIGSPGTPKAERLTRVDVEIPDVVGAPHRQAVKRPNREGTLRNVEPRPSGRGKPGIIFPDSSRPR